MGDNLNQSIRIRNFLVIKKADVDIRKINVIIGPQANGKSVIAKLVSFFLSLSADFVDGVKAQDGKRELNKSIISKFESRFPRYSWEGTSFEVDFEVDGLLFQIRGIKNAKGKTALSFLLPDKLSRHFFRKKILFMNKLKEEKESQKVSKKISNLERKVFHEIVYEPMLAEFPTFFAESVFVPASRSFFANLQKNIFTFLASNLDVDPYIKEFGRIYESSKYWYKDPYLFSGKSDLAVDIYKIVEQIVKGEYEYHDEQDWIVSRGRKINLANASSGQQESLPMLLVLSVWPLLTQTKGMFFIEEPEAHLFPLSQSHIVSLFSLLYSSLDTNFFITTHSPYVLSAINNCMLAADCVSRGDLSLGEYTKINGSGVPIAFEDVSAYTILDGELRNISDSEYRMIGGEVLDGVSGHFEDVMNMLLSCGKN